MKIYRVALAFTLIAGCTSPAPKEPAHQLPDTGLPALHALHEERLRNLMQEMNNLMFDRIRTELEIDRERRKHALAIAKSAGQLASAIDAIVEEMPKLDLTVSEQTAFKALASKLHRQTELLQDQANRNHIDAIPGTLQQMTLTCTSCHQLFRSTDVQSPREN